MSGGTETSAALPKPGDRIADKYRVVDVLGSGGMGYVIGAVHEALGQQVAIKFLHADALKEPGIIDRFLREGRAACAISGDHVVRVLDVGTIESGAPFLVMERLEGEDLDKHLVSRKRLPASEAVDHVLAACEALAEAHGRGIIHRDLKPSNLFLARQVGGRSVLKVLDFGISKMTSTEGSNDTRGVTLTARGMIVGSPAYMSPEQVRGDADVDARTDIWSLGIILYELLAGEAPWSAPTASATLARVLTAPLMPLDEAVAGVPRDLADVVARCLDRNAETRIPSVVELARALARFAGPAGPASVEHVFEVAGAFAPPPGAALCPTLTSAGEAAPRPTGAAGTAAAWSESKPRAKTTRASNRTLIVALAMVALAVGMLAAFGAGSKTAKTSAPVAAAPRASAPAPLASAPSTLSPPAPPPTAIAIAPSPLVTLPAPTAALPSAAPAPSTAPSAHRTGTGATAPAKTGRGGSVEDLARERL